jgi:hypothetical protein
LISAVFAGVAAGTELDTSAAAAKLTDEQATELIRLFIIGKRVRLKDAENFNMQVIRQRTPEDVRYVLTAMLQTVTEEFTARRANQ